MSRAEYMSRKSRHSGGASLASKSLDSGSISLVGFSVVYSKCGAEEGSRHRVGEQGNSEEVSVAGGQSVEGLPEGPEDDFDSYEGSRKVRCYLCLCVPDRRRGHGARRADS
jgi:hypothetical protein